MPTLHLTKRAIDAIPFSGKQTLYHDVHLTGFGLLVSARSKAYFVQKAVGGKTVRTVIGRHGIFTPDSARKEALNLLQKMSKGINPNQEKRQSRVKAITLQDAFEQRMAAKSTKLSQRTLSDYRGIIESYLKDWKNLSLFDITKDMIMQRFAHISVNHGQATANKTFRVFGVTYNYARYLNQSLPESPVIVLSLTKSWHASKRRQTVVKANELTRWFAAVEAEPNTTMRDYLILLVFSGLRRNEAAGLMWKHVDFVSQTITIPVTKNGHPLTLPIGSYILSLLQERQHCSASEFVFEGNGESGHITEPKKAIARVRKVSGVHFTAHDLRRTFVTTAERLDVPHFAIKYLINHRTNSDVTGGYMVFDAERMREPMRRIEEELIRLMGTPCLKDI